MQNQHYAVIMAGGIGSRFWPVSRSSYPKQFHDILGTGKSLIRSTFERFQQFLPVEHILVVTNAAYVDLVLEQLPELKPAQVLAEPIGRNTAPCLLYANKVIGQQHENAQIIVSPADHLIMNDADYIHDLKLGLELAGKGEEIITLGILPSRPDTGYGYIQYYDGAPDAQHFPVKTFTEKPNLEMAKTFVQSGDFLWNSGIFIFDLQLMNRAFQEHLPEMWEQFDTNIPSDSDAHQEVVRSIYEQVKPISIDYGIMEQVDKVRVIKSTFGWSDLGTWSSLHEQSDRDFYGNAVSGEVVVYEAKNNVIKNMSDNLLVVKGLEDFVVVQTQDVTLVCPLKDEQSIKEIVTDMKQHKTGKSLV